MPDMRKIAADAAIAEGLCCSFCGQDPAEDGEMVVSGDLVICDECIADCSEMIANPSTSRDDESDEEGDDVSDDDERAAPKPAFFRLISDADLEHLLPMDDLIDAMGTALGGFSAGKVVQPVRSVLPIGGGRDFFGVMPAYITDPPAFGAKLVTVFGRNTAVDLPTHLAVVLLFSTDTGALVAAMNGRYITEARTAAVSAVSADLLARDDASVLAIIGSGVQARSHLVAMDRVFELSEIRVWSPNPDHQATFVDEMKSSTSARLVGSDSAEQAVQGADVIVLVTSSTEPVVQNEWIKSGAHVISVGACRPDQREMDPALVQRGRLFVDSRAAALAESGDIVMGIHDRLFTASHIAGEIGEVLNGKAEGRRSPRDVTIFKSLGLAVEDVAAADLAYRRAVTRNAGQELEL
jgi:thiomorpholine-carboxylate dehydrogenase